MARGSPVQCGIFSSILGLYLLEASVTSSPFVTSKDVSNYSQMSPMGQNHLQSRENHSPDTVDTNTFLEESKSKSSNEKCKGVQCITYFLLANSLHKLY